MNDLGYLVSSLKQVYGEDGITMNTGDKLTYIGMEFDFNRETRTVHITR